MANITMWAQKMSSSNANVMDARHKAASYNTSETIIISQEDVTKIRKDAELAIIKDKKLTKRVYGTPNLQYSTPMPREL